MKQATNQILSIFQKNGYKITQQRLAVLKIVSCTNDHLTPAEIFEKSQKEYHGIGLVTIYRTLEILEKLSLLCRVHTEKTCHNYLLRRPAEHHHHLTCSSCGVVKDFTNCNLKDLENKLSKETGFKVSSHLLEFHGLCPDCTKGT